MNPVVLVAGVAALVVAGFGWFLCAIAGIADDVLEASERRSS